MPSFSHEENSEDVEINKKYFHDISTLLSFIFQSIVSKYIDVVLATELYICADRFKSSSIYNL